MAQETAAGDLAAALRRLRQRAQRQPGGGTVSKLASATKVSSKSIYAYLAGTTLPPAEVFDDLLQALSATGEERTQLWHLRDSIEELRRGRPEPASVERRRQKVIGILPLGADNYITRSHGWPALQAGPATVVLAGLGGVGKTQIAARHARELLRSGAVDLLLWISASSRDSVVSGYARAADEIGLGAADAEDAAARLHAWFETTDWRWLVVFDDVAEAVRGLWPPIERGRVIVTTRRRDSAIRSGGRIFVQVEPFSEPEALDYLQRKLVGSGDDDDSLRALAAEFGGHPLALAQVCSYIRDRAMPCDEYRRLFVQHRSSLRKIMPESAVLPDDQALTADAIWSLSIARADELTPVGLASAALTMASVLSGTAAPVDLWASKAGLAFLSRARADDHPVTAQQAHDSLHNLARLSLVDIDDANAMLSVHTLVQASVRSGLGTAVLADVVRVSADALAEIWPDRRDAAVGQVLRANGNALSLSDAEAMWTPAVHQVVYKIGNSLGDLGHLEAATRYFDDVVARAAAVYGETNRETVCARVHRAVWTGKRGNLAVARDELEVLVELAHTVLDPRDSLNAEIRGNHAYFVGRTGDYAMAMELTRAVLHDFPAATLDATAAFALQSNIAFFAGHLGRHSEAADAHLQLAQQAEATLGPDHVDTMKLWANAIGWRGKAGDPAGSLREFYKLLSRVERTLGHGHTLAIRTRFHIARLTRECGGPDAISQIDDILAASTELLGWDHPHTIDIRVESALLAHDRGDPEAALSQLTDIAETARQVFGEDHPRTTAITKHLADLA